MSVGAATTGSEARLSPARRAGPLAVLVTWFQEVRLALVASVTAPYLKCSVSTGRLLSVPSMESSVT